MVLGVPAWQGGEPGQAAQLAVLQVLQSEACGAWHIYSLETGEDGQTSHNCKTVKIQVISRPWLGLMVFNVRQLLS